MPLEEEHRCMLFVYGALQRLDEWKLVDNLEGLHAGNIEPLGVGMFDQLEASGYRPTEEEVLECIKFFDYELGGQLDKEVFDALVEFISRWDDLKKFISKEK
jgi:hypothetical protein